VTEIVGRMTPGSLYAFRVGSKRAILIAQRLLEVIEGAGAVNSVVKDSRGTGGLQIN